MILLAIDILNLQTSSVEVMMMLSSVDVVMAVRLIVCGRLFVTLLLKLLCHGNVLPLPNYQLYPYMNVLCLVFSFKHSVHVYTYL